MNFIVESDVIIRAVDKPFNERQHLGSFPTGDIAYQFIEKYFAQPRQK